MKECCIDHACFWPLWNLLAPAHVFPIIIHCNINIAIILEVLLEVLQWVSVVNVIVYNRGA